MADRHDRQDKKLWAIEAVYNAAGCADSEKRETLRSLVTDWCRAELPPPPRKVDINLVTKERCFDLKSNERNRRFLTDSTEAKELTQRLQPYLNEAQRSNAAYKPELVVKFLISQWNSQSIEDRIWKNGRSFIDGEQPQSDVTPDQNSLHSMVTNLGTRIPTVEPSGKRDRSPSVSTTLSYRAKPRVVWEDVSFIIDTSACREARGIGQIVVLFNQTVNSPEKHPLSKDDFDIGLFRGAILADDDTKEVSLDRMSLLYNDFGHEFRFKYPDIMTIINSFSHIYDASRRGQAWIKVKLVYGKAAAQASADGIDPTKQQGCTTPLKRKADAISDSSPSSTPSTSKRLNAGENRPSSKNSLVGDVVMGDDDNPTSIISSDETLINTIEGSRFVRQESQPWTSDSDVPLRQIRRLRRTTPKVDYDNGGNHNTHLSTSPDASSSSDSPDEYDSSADSDGTGKDETTADALDAVIEEDDIEVDSQVRPNRGRGAQKPFHIDGKYGSGALCKRAQIDAMSVTEFAEFAQFYTKHDGTSPNKPVTRWNEEDVSKAIQLLNMKDLRRLAKHKKTKVRSPAFICKPGHEPYLWQMVDAALAIHCFWKVGGVFVGHTPGYGKTYIYWAILIWLVTYSSNYLDWQLWKNQKHEYKGRGHLTEEERQEGRECPSLAFERSEDVGFQLVACPCELNAELRPDPFIGPHRLLGTLGNLVPHLVATLQEAMNISAEHKPYKPESGRIWRPNMRLLLFHNTVSQNQDRQITDKDKKLMAERWTVDLDDESCNLSPVPLIGYVIISTQESYHNVITRYGLTGLSYGSTAVDEAHTKKSQGTQVTKLDDEIYTDIRDWRQEDAERNISRDRRAKLGAGLTIWMTASVLDNIFPESFQSLIQVMEKRASVGRRPWVVNSPFSNLRAGAIEKLIPLAKALKDEMAGSESSRRLRMLHDRDQTKRDLASVEYQLILRGDHQSSRFGQLLAPQSSKPTEVVEIEISEEEQRIQSEVVKGAMLHVYSKHELAKRADKKGSSVLNELMESSWRQYEKNKLLSVGRYLTEVGPILKDWQQHMLTHYTANPDEIMTAGPHKDSCWSKLTSQERKDILKVRFTVEQMEQWLWVDPTHYADEHNIFDMFFDRWVRCCVFIEPLLVQIRDVEARKQRPVYLVTCAEISVCIVIDMWLRRMVIPRQGAHHFTTRQEYKIVSFNSVQGKKKNEAVRSFQGCDRTNLEGPNILISTNKRVAVSFNFGHCYKHFQCGAASCATEHFQLSGRVVREDGQGQVVEFQVQTPRDASFRANLAGTKVLNQHLQKFYPEIASLYRGLESSLTISKDN